MFFDSLNKYINFSQNPYFFLVILIVFFIAILILIINFFKKTTNNQDTKISSTMDLSIGDKINLISNNTDHYNVQILNITPKSIILTTPKNIYDDNIDLKKNDKCTFIFEKEDIDYILMTNILKVNPNNTFEIIHSSNIQSLKRRKDKRVNYIEDCEFYGTKTISQGKTNKLSFSYEAFGNPYKAKLQDISCGGCCIITDYNLHDNQYIQICAKLDDKNVDNIIGLIVNCEKFNDKYKLHIKFVRIDKKTRNKILSIVYTN